MIPNVPDQRKFKSNVSKPFNDLVAYLEENKGPEKQHEHVNEFANILNYATSPLDKSTKEDKCIAIRTHGVIDLAGATEEMNAVAAKNQRCKDPAFHFILSWPDHERPHPDAIFDAAEHAIKALGLGAHQYVLAVHGNTDNKHCHIAVNRIHPITFKSQNIEWAYKTLHMAARQSELKHGWTNDNGIYIVERDEQGKKHIILNPDHANALINTIPYAHAELVHDKLLPTWHDPDSLDSYLKSTVARALKRDLPKLNSWSALHSWLSNYDITLDDTGGGGMRLHAISPESGENLDLPASRGLRLLKRSELEKRWGQFTNSIPIPCITSDLSHLTRSQITKGVEHVLTRSLDHGIPPDHILRANPITGDRAAGRNPGPHAQRAGSLHELPAGGLDADRQNGKLLLPDALHNRLGDKQTGKGTDLRRPGTGEAGSRGGRSLTRDNSKREERKNQRAAARADLRKRFSQYKQFVRIGDIEHVKRIKEIRDERNQTLKDIRERTKVEKSIIKRDRSRTHESQAVANTGLDVFVLRHKMQAEATFQEKFKSLRITRTPPLAWRTWLHEQANLGDQAALSALRGIVYQALRDAKGKDSTSESVLEEEKEADTEEYREQQYKKAMARLLEEEKKEIAIRSARSNAMRPYEADALLARYIGIQWRVTGNGNIEYSDRSGDHLFTDRGNRVTFDRVRVSDEEIRLALAHAQQKFGNQLTLTGEDPDFSARMARLADDMGMTILNPDLQSVIVKHRADRELQIIEAITIAPAEVEITPVALATPPPAITVSKPTQTPVPIIEPEITPQQAPSPAETTKTKEDAIPETPDQQTPQERLRAMVLAIDPRAEFEIPDPADKLHIYTGPVAVTLDATEAAQGFAQHTGRGKYALHPINAPKSHAGLSIDVKYQNGKPIATVVDHQKGKGRTD